MNPYFKIKNQASGRVIPIEDWKCLKPKNALITSKLILTICRNSAAKNLKY